MLFNWKLKILSSIVAVAMLFTMCHSTTFAVKTYLHEVLENKDHALSLEEIEHIVSRHPEYISEKDEYGKTPLHLAAEEGKLEVVKYLVAHGANISSEAGDMKWTPLHFAAENGHLEVVKYLVERGAKVDCIDLLGRTPLYWAASKDNLEVVKCLIKQGADVNRKDIDGKTPLDIAKDNGLSEIVSFLHKSASSRYDQLSDFFTSFTHVPIKIAVLEEQIEELKRNQLAAEKRAAEACNKVTALEAQIEELKRNQLTADEKIKKLEEKVANHPLTEDEYGFIAELIKLSTETRPGGPPLEMLDYAYGGHCPYWTAKDYAMYFAICFDRNLRGLQNNNGQIKALESKFGIICPDSKNDLSAPMFLRIKSDIKWAVNFYSDIGAFKSYGDRKFQMKCTNALGLIIGFNPSNNELCLVKAGDPRGIWTMDKNRRHIMSAQNPNLMICTDNTNDYTRPKLVDKSTVTDGSTLTQWSLNAAGEIVSVANSDQMLNVLSFKLIENQPIIMYHRQDPTANNDKWTLSSADVGGFKSWIDKSFQIRCKSTPGIVIGIKNGKLYSTSDADPNSRFSIDQFGHLRNADNPNLVVCIGADKNPTIVDTSKDKSATPAIWSLNDAGEICRDGDSNQLLNIGGGIGENRSIILYKFQGPNDKNDKWTLASV